MKSKLYIILFIVAQLTGTQIFSQDKTGTIKGKVTSAVTHEPLIGVNVMLKGTTRGAATNNDGMFSIANVPAGSYIAEFHYIGYEKLSKPDIIVRPARITYANAELTESVIQSEEIVITAGYFQKKESDPLSVVSFNGEEVRRSPAAAGDVSRIMSVLPSVAQVADNANDLAVRGGSPVENGFYVDNIPIPNINHFPVQGSSGGPIGMLNTDFIDDVSFYSGGFSAMYGDRLSSVMNIKLREGNRDEYDGQIDLSMGGFGGIIEGPMFDKRGSFLVSLRRSYLDWIVEAIGTGAVPKYGDLHVKTVFDLNKNHQLTLLNITGLSTINFTQKDARESGNPGYGLSEGTQSTIGANLASVWNSHLFSNTSFSYRFLDANDRFKKTVNSELFVDNNSLESAFQFRNVSAITINKQHRVEFGADAVVQMEDYEYEYGRYTNRLGDTLPGLKVDHHFKSAKAGGFISYNWTPTQIWTITAGLRGDYYHYNRNLNIAPRLATSVKATERLTLNASWGMYYQNLPMLILSQDSKNKKLKDPRSTHYVAGFDYMLTEDTKLSVEGYLKEYDQFPMDQGDPMLFVLDDGTSMSRFNQYTDLVDNGRAQTRGVEVMIQKKLAKDFYGLVSGSVFKSRYRDLNKKWHNRMYDNKYVFNVVGGYKPNNKWEFSLRWTYAGGVPYTPFDQDLSRLANSGIIDATRINKERYPDYHTLNIRFDRRFHFRGSALVAYLNLFNAYNRKNIATYYWNEIDNKQDKMYQWTLIPVGGFEYEF